MRHCWLSKSAVVRGAAQLHVAAVAAASCRWQQRACRAAADSIQCKLLEVLWGLMEQPWHGLLSYLASGWHSLHARACGATRP